MLVPLPREAVEGLQKHFKVEEQEPGLYKLYRDATWEELYGETDPLGNGVTTRRANLFLLSDSVHPYAIVKGVSRRSFRRRKLKASERKLVAFQVKNNVPREYRQLFLKSFTFYISYEWREEALANEWVRAALFSPEEAQQYE